MQAEQARKACIIRHPCDKLGCGDDFDLPGACGGGAPRPGTTDGKRCQQPSQRLPGWEPSVSAPSRFLSPCPFRKYLSLWKSSHGTPTSRRRGRVYSQPFTHEAQSISGLPKLFQGMLPERQFQVSPCLYSCEMRALQNVAFLGPRVELFRSFPSFNSRLARDLPFGFLF